MGATLATRKEIIMANIGTFTAQNDGFIGTVRTLTLNVKVKFVRNDKSSENAPDYRIQAGTGYDIGAAWKKVSQAERPYLSVTLDDPSFPTTIYARLIEEEDGTQRVLPPPALAAGRYADAPPTRADDWSCMAIPAVPLQPAAGVDLTDGDTAADDGGPRRQPELSEVTEYHTEQEPISNDLALLDDDDLPLPLPRQLDPAMQRTARLASLDPDDGIQL